jgi:hypothetical protein
MTRPLYVFLLAASWLTAGRSSREIFHDGQFNRFHVEFYEGQSESNFIQVTYLEVIQCVLGSIRRNLIAPTRKLLILVLPW